MYGVLNLFMSERLLLNHFVTLSMYFHSHRKSRLDLPQLSFDSLFVGFLHLESRILTNSNNTIRLSANKILLDDRNLEGNQFGGNILYSPQQLSKLTNL